MAYEQRDNSGSMFDNDRKTTDNHPDFKGSCMVSGVEYWVSGWDKTPEGKRPYMSLAFKKKEPKADTAPQQEPKAKAPVKDRPPTQAGLPGTAQRLQDMEDDIPF